MLCLNCVLDVISADVMVGQNKASAKNFSVRDILHTVMISNICETKKLEINPSSG